MLEQQWTSLYNSEIGAKLEPRARNGADSETSRRSSLGDLLDMRAASIAALLLDIAERPYLICWLLLVVYKIDPTSTMI